MNRQQLEYKATRYFDLDLDRETVTIFYVENDPGEIELLGVLNSKDTEVELDAYNSEYFEHKSFDHYINNVVYYSEIDDCDYE